MRSKGKCPNYWSIIVKKTKKLHWFIKGHMYLQLYNVERKYRTALILDFCFFQKYFALNVTFLAYFSYHTQCMYQCILKDDYDGEYFDRWKENTNYWANYPNKLQAS